MAWLTAYMEPAYSALADLSNPTPNDVDAALSTEHDTLIDEWVGTPDDPGPMTAIVLIGMISGELALQQARAGKAAVDIGIDWTLFAQEAADYARAHTSDMVDIVDQTTREAVRKIIADAVEQGMSVSDIKRELLAYFSDAERARVIAQTETTAAYYQGSKDRWQKQGVRRARWRTANDEISDRCPICGPLHNQEYDLDAGAWSDAAGQNVFPPAHPKCRCSAVPVMSEDE